MDPKKCAHEPCTCQPREGSKDLLGVLREVVRHDPYQVQLRTPGLPVATG